MASQQAGLTGALPSELLVTLEQTTFLGKMMGRYMQQRACDMQRYLYQLLDFGAKTGSPFLTLPLDVFLDEIFLYLYIEDILALRQVNKAFFLITHEPIIWKRFLTRMNISIPPLRPTFRWSLSLTSFEIEQLVTQAITADDNWRRPNPRLFATRRLSTGHYRTTDMYLLPGARYLVTSCQTMDKVHFHLSVWALDHPMGPREIARIPTLAEAFRLEAKVMRLYDGEEGLVISYVRRIFNWPQPVGRTPSDYSWRHGAEPPGGFTYEAMAVYTSFSLIELMSSPDLVMGSPDYNTILSRIQPPFQELGKITAPFPIKQLSLFEVEDMKLLGALVDSPGGGELYFANLQDPTQNATIHIRDHHAHEGKPHRLRAFRVYPNQQDMVVVRSVSPEPGVERQLVECLDLPHFLGHIIAASKARYSMDGKDVKSFHISDYGTPGRKKYHPGHPTFRHSQGPPPPVSIYLELQNPSGCEHHAVYPTQTPVVRNRRRTHASEGKDGDIAMGDTTMDGPEPEPTEYKYEYDHNTFQMTVHLSQARPEILPGSHRAMVCMFDANDRTDHPKILKLRRYVHPHNSLIEYSDDPAMGPPHEPVLRRAHLAMPKAEVYCTFDMGSVLDEINEMGGVQAMCWDESTGRTILAPYAGGVMHVLEFSHIVPPDRRFEEWKKERVYLFPPPMPLTMPGGLGEGYEMKYQ